MYEIVRNPHPGLLAALKRAMAILADWSRAPDPLNLTQIRPMFVTSRDGVPLAGVVVELAPPNCDVRAVLGVTRSVLVSDHPESVTGAKAEAPGVVVHGPTVGRGSNRRSPETAEAERDTRVTRDLGKTR